MRPYTDALTGLRDYRHPGVRLRAPWRIGRWLIGLVLMLVALLWVWR